MPRIPVQNTRFIDPQAERTPANWRKLELGGTIGYLMEE